MTCWPSVPNSVTAVSIAVFGGAIALIAFAHFKLGLNAVLAFWLAYILTRPLGASIGDFMSQSDPQFGGLGLGSSATSYIFLGCILLLVAYLTVTRKDQTPLEVVLAEEQIEEERAAYRNEHPHHPHLPDVHLPHVELGHGAPPLKPARDEA